MLIYNPRQTVLVSCRGEGKVLGKVKVSDEVFPCDWHTPLSHQPPVYGVCVSKSMEFALGVIRSSGHFVVNFMSVESARAVQECGLHAGHLVEKFERAGLSLKEAQMIDAPVVGQAVGVLECEVAFEKDFGDHVFFAGRVLHSELRDALAKRLFHIDAEEYSTLS